MTLQRIDNEAGRITAMILDAASQTLVVGDEAGVIRIWKLGDSPEVVRDIEPPFMEIRSLAWRPDRQSFISVGEGQIGAFTLAGKPLGSWPTVDAGAQSVAVVSPEHALVGYNGSVLRLIDMHAGAVLAELPAGERNTGITPHPDGKRFAVSACDQAGSRILWVALDGQALRPLPAQTIDRVADHLSPPAIDAGGTRLMVADDNLHIFDVESARRLQSFSPSGRRRRVPSRPRYLVERPFSPCVAIGSEALASSGPDGPLIVFDVATERLSDRYEFKAPATALASDGAVFAAAGADWHIAIWWP